MFLAKVPRGGVAAGEVFASRMYSVYDEDNYPDRGSVFKDMDTPDARWRDELFDCFHHGFLHPFLLNTIFCPQGTSSDLRQSSRIERITFSNSAWFFSCACSSDVTCTNILHGGQGHQTSRAIKSKKRGAIYFAGGYRARGLLRLSCLRSSST